MVKLQKIRSSYKDKFELKKQVQILKMTVFLMYQINENYLQ